MGLILCFYDMSNLRFRGSEKDPDKRPTTLFIFSVLTVPRKLRPI